MSKNRNILVVDDDRLILELLDEYLRNFDYRMFAASDDRQALDILAEQDIPVALVDIRLSDTNRFALVDRLHRIKPGLRIVLATSFPTLESVLLALHHDVFDVIIKPFRLEKLAEMIDRAIVGSPRDVLTAALRDRVRQLEETLRDHGITPPDETGDISAAADSGLIADASDCGHGVMHLGADK